VDAEMLSERLRRGGGETAGGYAEEVRAFKVRLLRDALSRSGGNRAAAARLLGLHPSNLMRMIRELGIDVPAPSRSPGAR
jgi:transcriptional regulator with GAF, ATPase, and Fis domain